MTELPALHQDRFQSEIDRIAARHRRANGPVIALVNRLGGAVERQLALIPPGLRDRIAAVTAAALQSAHGVAGLAAKAPDLGAAGPMAAVVASGLVGGAGGLPSALAELPVTITLMLHAIRREAKAAGFDPDDEAIRAECLQVFSAASPLAADDGANTAFLSVRLSLTGSAMQRLIAAVAPRLAAAMGQKLAAQAVPVLGAITGAGLNAAYLHYYRDIAHIRFALLRLAQTHGSEAVTEAFRKAVNQPDLRRA